MRVLVTGASGYIGSRLVPQLLEAGHHVSAGGRDPKELADFAWAEQVDLVEFDVTDETVVLAAVESLDAVVYLVHSMGDGDDFAHRDREAAELTARACAKHGVRRLVYLSGLVPAGELSEHLSSRLEVEQIFLDSDVPATVLRAAMVIGAGSTSFEMLRRMTERVPLVPVPAWMRRALQPVAVEDVVEAIAQALGGDPRNRHYDLGGDEVVSYRELLAEFADVAGLRRPQFVVPLVPQWLVSEVIALVAGMPRSTVHALVESLSHDMVCGEDDIRTELLADHDFTSIREAFERSLQGETAATTVSGDVQGEAATDDF